MANRTQAEIKAAALEAGKLVENGATGKETAKVVNFHNSAVSVALALAGVRPKYGRTGYVSPSMEAAINAVEAGASARAAAGQAGVSVNGLYIALRRRAARISGAAS